MTVQHKHILKSAGYLYTKICQPKSLIYIDIYAYIHTHTYIHVYVCMYVVGFLIVLQFFSSQQFFSHSAALLCTFSLQAKDGEGGKKIVQFVPISSLLTARIKRGQRAKDLSQIPEAKLHHSMMPLMNIASGKSGVSKKDQEQLGDFKDTMN